MNVPSRIELNGKKESGSSSASPITAGCSSSPAENDATPFLEPVLRIGGVTPLSTVDWPGQLAAVVFLQGCPWRCAYCHNNDLQSACGDGRVPWAQLESLLKLRKGLLDGVVFSGGEPTAQGGLVDAVQRVRELGYACALHTAGVYPRRLAQVLPQLDWVALDIKALPDEYDALTGVAGSHARVDESLALLLASKKSFECRSTVDWSQLSPVATK